MKLKKIIRGLLLEKEPISWLKLEDKHQLLALQEEMFRTDKKNKKYKKNPQVIILVIILSQKANKYQKSLINLYSMQYQILSI